VLLGLGSTHTAELILIHHQRSVMSTAQSIISCFDMMMVVVQTVACNTHSTDTDTICLTKEDHNTVLTDTVEYCTECMAPCDYGESK